MKHMKIASDVSPRRLRASLGVVQFLLLYVAPVVVIIGYIWLIASDRFVSTASVIVTEEKSSSASLDLSLLSISGPSSSDQVALVVKEFMESKDMLRYLDETLKLRTHYSQPNIDFWSRLKPNASWDEFSSYLAWYVSVTYDIDAKILRLSAEAFEPKLARAIIEKIIERSQVFIDRMNDKVTSEQLRFFNNQVDAAAQRLKESKKRLTDFQQKNLLLSTETEGQTVLAMITSLEQALAQKRSELESRLRVLDRSAPQLRPLQIEVKGLQAQIAQLKQRLAGKAGDSVSELDTEFRDIQMDYEFKTASYKSNIEGLEQARNEAIRRMKFLIVVAQPLEIDRAELPDRGYVTITTALVMLVVYFVLSLVVTIAREHI